MLGLGKPKADLDWLEDVGLDGAKPFHHTDLGAAFLADSYNSR